MKCNNCDNIIGAFSFCYTNEDKERYCKDCYDEDWTK